MTDDLADDPPDDDPSGFEPPDAWRTAEDRLDDLEAEVAALRQGLQVMAESMTNLCRVATPTMQSLLGTMRAINAAFGTIPEEPAT